MNVKQVYALVNDATAETIGESTILAEDLSNVVSVGDTIQTVMGLDNFVRSLTDRIGKVIFVDRAYRGNVPSILMDGFEFGAILEKIQMDLPDATENESWELQDQTSYDPNIFYKPAVTAKFWNDRVTFEIPISITEKQVKSAFASASDLGRFVSMIYNWVEKSMQIKLDSLIRRVINNYIGVTVHDNNTNRYVKLLTLYNAGPNAGQTALTADAAIYDPEFIRFAASVMGKYTDRLGSCSVLYNKEGKVRQTPADELHVVLLSEFARQAETYLYSDTYHDNYVALPKAETVPCWQGSGTDFSFANASKVSCKTSEGDTVTADKVIGVMFDTNACAVCNMDRRTTSQYNPRGEFYSQWAKMDAMYLNAFDENFVVFAIA